MYLSDRDIHWAVEKGTLLIRPSSKIDPTSIDLHLDRVEEVQVWDTAKLVERNAAAGNDEPEVHLGTFHYGKFSEEYLAPPPDYSREDKSVKVCRRGPQIISSCARAASCCGKPKKRLGRLSTTPNTSASSM
jgi:hypothetical protein